MHDAPVGRNLPGRLLRELRFTKLALSFLYDREPSVNESLRWPDEAAEFAHFLMTSTFRFTETEP